MKSLRNLKNSLAFNKDLDDLMNTSKIATMIQLRQLQGTDWGEERFLPELRSFFSMLKKDVVYNHPLIVNENTTPKCIVAITSDEGFLGELNALIMEAALREQDVTKDTIIVVGKKGEQYLDEMKKSYLSFPWMSSDGYGELDKLSRYLVEKYLKAEFNQVVVVYADFKSIMVQHVRIQKLLPFPMRELDGFLEQSKEHEKLLVGPSRNKVIEGLINLNLIFLIYRIFYSSKLSEFSARLMHLERSGQEIIRVNRSLRLEYFKSAHSLADKRIREILSSRILATDKKIRS
ncbi:MAG: F0F1 ATP synthase subunit gamma [PVC group bacterium]|nr:F0F1 ATP synthase subunit gamma [PVC group bacterium]